MRVNKFLVFFLLILFVVISGFIFVLNTDYGKNIIKEYIEIKIHKYMPGVRITYIDYGLKDFSVTLKKGENIVKIYGDMFPLNAVFEGKLKDVSVLYPELRGEAEINGNVYKKNGFYLAEGKAFFADGFMNFSVKFNKYIELKGEGEEFDLQKLFYMTYKDFPYLKGRTALKILKTPQQSLIKLKSVGVYTKVINTHFESQTSITGGLKSGDFVSEIKTDMGKFRLKGKYNDNLFKYVFRAENVKLNALKPLLIFPFKCEVSFKGDYEPENKTIKFKGKDFEGYMNKKINITFKTTSQRFFNCIGVKKLFDGKIFGNIKINNQKGDFNIVCEKVKFLKNILIARIYRQTGIDITKQNINKMFIKGEFDNKRVLLDILGSMKNFSFNVKKGVWEYAKKLNMILYMRKNGVFYKILISGNKVKLLKQRKVRKTDNTILVY